MSEINFFKWFENVYLINPNAYDQTTGSPMDYNAKWLILAMLHNTITSSLDKLDYNEICKTVYYNLRTASALDYSSKELYKTILRSVANTHNTNALINNVSPLDYTDEQFAGVYQQFFSVPLPRNADKKIQYGFELYSVDSVTLLKQNPQINLEQEVKDFCKDLTQKPNIFARLAARILNFGEFEGKDKLNSEILSVVGLTSINELANVSIESIKPSQRDEIYDLVEFGTITGKKASTLTSFSPLPESKAVGFVAPNVQMKPLIIDTSTGQKPAVTPAPSSLRKPFQQPTAPSPAKPTFNLSQVSTPATGSKTIASSPRMAPTTQTAPTMPSPAGFKPQQPSNVPAGFEFMTQQPTAPSPAKPAFNLSQVSTPATGSKTIASSPRMAPTTQTAPTMPSPAGFKPQQGQMLPPTSKPTFNPQQAPTPVTGSKILASSPRMTQTMPPPPAGSKTQGQMLPPPAKTGFDPAKSSRKRPLEDGEEPSAKKPRIMPSLSEGNLLVPVSSNIPGFTPKPPVSASPSLPPSTPFPVSQISVSTSEPIELSNLKTTHAGLFKFLINDYNQYVQSINKPNAIATDLWKGYVNSKRTNMASFAANVRNAMGMMGVSPQNVETFVIDWLQNGYNLISQSQPVKRMSLALELNNQISIPSGTFEYQFLSNAIGAFGMFPGSVVLYYDFDLETLRPGILLQYDISSQMALDEIIDQIKGISNVQQASTTRIVPPRVWIADLFETSIGGVSMKSIPTTHFMPIQGILQLQASQISNLQKQLISTESSIQRKSRPSQDVALLTSTKPQTIFAKQKIFDALKNQLPELAKSENVKRLSASLTNVVKAVMQANLRLLVVLHKLIEHEIESPHPINMLMKDIQNPLKNHDSFQLLYQIIHLFVEPGSFGNTTRTNTLVNPQLKPQIESEAPLVNKSEPNSNIESPVNKTNILYPNTTNVEITTGWALQDHLYNMIMNLLEYDSTRNFVSNFAGLEFVAEYQSASKNYVKDLFEAILHYCKMKLAGYENATNVYSFIVETRNNIQIPSTQISSLQQSASSMFIIIKLMYGSEYDTLVSRLKTNLSSYMNHMKFSVNYSQFYHYQSQEYYASVKGKTTTSKTISLVNPNELNVQIPTNIQQQVNLAALQTPSSFQKDDWSQIQSQVKQFVETNWYNQVFASLFSQLRSQCIQQGLKCQNTDKEFAILMLTAYAKDMNNLLFEETGSVLKRISTALQFAYTNPQALSTLRDQVFQSYQKFYSK